ncbi:hypothetical protein QJS04_geneDACA000259 [Acorus gramineus]|uniref:Rieske domain-containing protein n=1 Tax=Acorus gramineus TaxID=55184 RepID=A0AAV9AQK4_ACOGR|nr:hypothetical protein QJS04_geneDACA000259 [Acorus gramineus]
MATMNLSTFHYHQTPLFPTSKLIRSSKTNPSKTKAIFISHGTTTITTTTGVLKRRNHRNPSQTPPRVATEEATTLGEEEEEGEEVSDSGSSDVPFSWRDHWYPVSLIEDLDRDRPTPFQLLGRDIVLWFDSAASKWVAFDDRCPHRLAPLSEGRVDEDGWLQCSYHGWSFDGDGACRRIPQAALDGPEARAMKSPRACVARLPTLVSQGLLFVWPDDNGWEKALASSPPMLPDEFNDPSFSTVTIQRDLFYGYDTLMENVSDPSHIEFAHHKVTMPGPAWWQLVPRWYEHWTSNKVYDGDMIVLQGQEKIFLSKSMEDSTDINQQYTKITFTPTRADRFVLAFRNWLRKHGNSQPEWFGSLTQQPLPSTVLSKYQTLRKVLICATVVLCVATGIPSETLFRVLIGVAAIASAVSMSELEILKRRLKAEEHVIVLVTIPNIDVIGYIKIHQSRKPVIDMAPKNDGLPKGSACSWRSKWRSLE